MTIVPAEVSHAASIAALEKQCFSMPWSMSSIISQIQNPSCRWFTALSCEKVLGYAGMQFVLDEGYIDNVAIDPDHRRQGIASALIERLCEECGALKLSFLSLEVRKSNFAAIELYKQAGFSQVGIRRGYYLRPTEDAVLMTRFFNY